MIGPPARAWFTFTSRRRITSKSARKVATTSMRVRPVSNRASKVR